MRLALQDAMRDILGGWQEDLDPRWRAVVADGDLGFAGIDPDLTLEAWEPVFPARKGRAYLGAPKGAHIFRAFDGIDPAAVRCVILGQDPYPCAAFATGRAFEAGNVAEWRELEKMFSVSVRTFMQQIAAARTGDGTYARTTADWERLRDDIEAGRLAFEPADAIANRWTSEGVLLLNSSLTISRFAVTGDPHQLRGHLPLWRPFMIAVIRYLSARGTPLVIIAFGDQAAAILAEADVVQASNDGGSARIACILRDHPARGNAVLALENPFVACNRLLATMGASPISW